MSDSPAPRLRKAASDLANRRFREAHAELMEVLKTDPGNAEAFYLLGVLAAEHQNHAKAVELFDRAIGRDASPARVHADRARSLVALSRHEEALAAVERAIRAADTSARTHDTIGVVLSRLGLHDRAVQYYRLATDAAPTNASYLYNLAAALQFVGDLEGADAAYRRTLLQAPGDVKSWYSLVSLTKQTRASNHIAALEALFPGLTDADDRLHIGHALAKTYEDIGDPEAAMAWLDRAKSLKRQQADPDDAGAQNLFAAASATASYAVGQGCPDPSPIFIVGMPRTGTTLLDRILSQHSDVISAGELSDFAIELKTRARTPSPYVLDAATLEAAARIDLSAVGEAYIRRARQVAGDAPRFVDKMPFNFFYSALILQALPNARVICLRRHPADAVLSNYRQLFATGFSYYTYGYDLAWSARFYGRFDRLMRHFRERLPPDRFTEVGYEAIVSDLEGEARRIVEFCGLDWQPQCVNFHENAAPVATASSSQVRQPLYSSSVGRWRRYAAHIRPALDVLVAEGVTIDP